MSTSCLHAKNCLDDIKTIRKYLKKCNNQDKKLLDFLNYIEYNIKEMKEHGQSMEDRLRIYKESIEALGFTRNKKVK